VINAAVGTFAGYPRAGAADCRRHRVQSNVTRTGAPIDARRDAVDAGTVTLTGFAREHSIGLTRFAYVLTGDRQLAQDLVQDCLLALYRRFGETLPLGAPLAYARKTITNGYVSRLRRLSSAELITDIVPDRPLPPADSTDQDAVWRVLATLPQRQRAVLVLRYYVDLSDAEIAQTMGCREGTVRSLAARAFAALREHPALATDAEEHQP
jgi:RNA polymerase sigma-70 factor (sigma-E family)